MYVVKIARVLPSQRPNDVPEGECSLNGRRGVGLHVDRAHAVPLFESHDDLLASIDEFDRIRRIEHHGHARGDAAQRGVVLHGYVSVLRRAGALRERQARVGG